MGLGPEQLGTQLMIIAILRIKSLQVACCLDRLNIINKPVHYNRYYYTVLYVMTMDLCENL